MSLLATGFTAPGSVLFFDLVTAWVLCPGRHTLSRLWSLMVPSSRHPYGAYARLVRCGRWSPLSLWARVAVSLAATLPADDRLVLVIDDTLFHKSGEHIDGAGIFRDAVRSTQSRLVTAMGLNLVVTCLRLRPPWDGEPLALPIHARLHRKGEETPLELAAAMIRDLALWLPSRRFVVVADGAYASLAGVCFPDGIAIVSRMRRDAAVYDLAPPRTGRRGRPRKRGDRLPSLLEMTISATAWRPHRLRSRSQEVERDLWSRQLLWYEVAKEHALLLVVVRDPTNRQRPDYFFTTDCSMDAATVAELYADRWTIEVGFRDIKQHLGAEDPQSWVGEGPERVVSLGCWLYSVTWLWFLERPEVHHRHPDRPWYPHKRTPSFLDALVALRHSIWHHRIFVLSGRHAKLDENSRALLTVLAEAA